MRKFLIILLSILLLLVSCATKVDNQEEPELPFVESTPEETPAPVVPEPEPEPVVPQEEPVLEPEPEPEPKLEPEPVVVEPVVEQEVIIVPVVIEEPAVEQPSEEDWSKVITASAPVEEQPQEQPQEEPEPEVKETTVEETKPVEEKAPAVTQTPANAQETAKPAINPSFVDKATDILKKIGQFIMKEKLMSIGFLTCFIGVIYLIVALVKTRRPRDRFDSYYSYQDKDYEEQEPVVEDPKPWQKKQDTEPEDEDDEFLRSLLGDNKD